MDKAVIKFAYADPCQDCHLSPGQHRKNYYRGPFRGGVEQHTCRVDPTSEPIGIQHPVTPGYTMAEVEIFDA